MELVSFIDPILAVFPRIPNAMLSLVFGYILLRIFLSVIGRLMKAARMTKGLREVIASMTTWVVWAVLISVIARNLGFSQISSTISGSLILVGFALANGASSLTADILSGLMLARDPDFNIGYKVKVGDMEGRIEKMDIRKVRISGKNQQTYVIANSQIDKSSWTLVSKD